MQMLSVVIWGPTVSSKEVLCWKPGIGCRENFVCTGRSLFAKGKEEVVVVVEEQVEVASSDSSSSSEGDANLGFLSASRFSQSVLHCTDVIPEVVQDGGSFDELAQMFHEDMKK